MHIKLDQEGKVIFGKFLIKTSQDLAPIPELSGYHIEGSGAIYDHISCYDDAEATQAMAILQKKSISAELVALEWSQEIINNVGDEVYPTVAEARSKLMVLKIASVVETGIEVPINVILPPSPLGKALSCNYTCKDPLSGNAYSISSNVDITSSTPSFTQVFITGGDYTIEMSIGGLYMKATIDVNSASKLTNAKQLHINQINELCNQTVLAGFKSWCLGREYTYDFDYEAQINFSGTLNAISSGMVTDIVVWKTKEGGPKPHTIQQFKALFRDGMVFKQQTIGKYWQLKLKILDPSCDTIQKIQAIVW